MQKSNDKANASTRKKVRFSALGLRGRLMMALIPSVVAILFATGVGNYSVSDHYINVALERFIRLQNLAVAHEVEIFLDQAREDLLYASLGEPTADNMRAFLWAKKAAGGLGYLEFTYLPFSGERQISLCRRGDLIVDLNDRQRLRVTPNPLLLLNDLKDLSSGQVWASPVMQVEYPLPSPEMENSMVRDQVIRFVTPYGQPGQSGHGLLMLSVAASSLRDILTLFNSEESPLWAFQRSGEVRYDYMVDPDGWMLFQSAEPDSANPKLSTYLARSGFDGTLGRPGLPGAFRPNSGYSYYWEVLDEIRDNKSGLKMIRDVTSPSVAKEYYLAYAPIRFNVGGEQGSVVYAGLVRVDRSTLPVLAGYRYLDVMLVVTVSAILLLAALIYILGRKLTSPIRNLSEQLKALPEVEHLEEIEIPYGGNDIEELKDSANAMIRHIRRQMDELREKDETILNVNLREPCDLSMEQELLDEVEQGVLPGIIGTGSKIAELKNDVLKAAQVDVDVLISGETGTGKQLVAEAMHSQSSRKKGPFISLNCGALDENLLLDALFGHVAGAFTEAKTARKGAFVEAGSGTLFLDEIQSASRKVQQSLLRALSIRKIKPLGSDVEIPIDVRIIAATNVDLVKMIEEESFREDLYYRLKVISIQVPALREHPENIPLLALHYLHQAKQLSDRSVLDFSKGALRKLCTHLWPGNIRELINCITRAAVMAETDVIQAEEIRLDADPKEPSAQAGVSLPKPTFKKPVQPQDASVSEAKEPAPVPDSDAGPQGLNPRQAKAWDAIRHREAITRSEYQELVGGNLSPRTANYDLNELVNKGLLAKQGKGPATRYVVVT